MKGDASLEANSPNGLSRGIWLMLVILGAVLAVIGWYRYYGG
jgi:hypothetical protein